jgi:hypothetical protein
MEVTKWLGNLAMFASCGRAAKAGGRGGKLPRVGFSQPLGSVMAGRRELVGQRSEGSEVKGYALNLTHSPENCEFWVFRPILSVRAQAMQEARDRRVPTAPPGSQTASSYTTAGKQPGERRSRALGEKRNASSRV